MEAFGLFGPKDVGKLFSFPFSYSFYQTGEFSAMCVMFGTERGVLGTCCTVRRKDVLNRAFYHANGEYVGCVPGNYPLAYVLDRAFLHAYRVACTASLNA